MAQQRPRIRIQTKRAVAKLEELGFDPLEALVRLFRDAVAADDRAMQLDCLKVIVPYGYSKAPNVSEHSGDPKQAVVLNVRTLEVGERSAIGGADEGRVLEHDAATALPAPGPALRVPVIAQPDGTATPRVAEADSDLLE